MLTKAVIAALVGVLIGGALMLSGSLREAEPPPAPIELRDLGGERDRGADRRRRPPRLESERSTVPVPSSPVPGEDRDDDDDDRDDDDGDDDDDDD